MIDISLVLQYLSIGTQGIDCLKMLYLPLSASMIIFNFKKE